MTWRVNYHIVNYLPLRWASVHWMVQCTLECHWNATGWPNVHWDTTGRPSEYLQGTLEHHWKNLVEIAPHWNATGETLTIFAYTGTPLEKLSWNCTTLGCHWRNSNFYSPHWNITGETVAAHAHTQAHIVKQGSIHASLKWQDGGTPISKWTGLCKFSSYLELIALQWITVLLSKYLST